MAIVNNAHYSFSGNHSDIGVIGTLGTSDTGGTALTLPFAVDDRTGAAWGIEIGTPTNKIVGGTFQVGSVSGRGSSGAALGATNFPVFVGGTDSGGTVYGLAVNSSGQITTSSSTGTNVNIFTGSVAIQTGTLGTVGTAADAGIAPLRVDSNNALWMNLGYKLDSTNDSISALVPSGTLTTIAAGTQNTLGTVGNINNGTVRISVGTIVSDTIVGGTLQNLVSGTLNAGTFTLNSKPGSTILSYGTFGAGTLGTLVAAPGVGTSIYVCSYVLDGDVTALGTPDIVLSFGTVQSGAGVIVRAGLLSTTPLVQSFAFPVSANVTNTPLTFMQLAGGGTMSWNITYFVQ